MSDSKRAIRWRGNVRRARAALVVAVGAVALAATAAPAAQAASGQVMCAYGEPVVGIWVDGNGGDGWASWSRTPQGAHLANFSRGGVGYPWRVIVGCGGSPARWASSSASSFTNASWKYWTCMGWTRAPNSYCA